MQKFTKTGKVSFIVIDNDKLSDVTYKLISNNATII